MGKYLDSSGVTYLWGKIKGLFTDSSLNTGAKTITGAINEINTKVNNLTGAFVWKGSFETEADKPSAATYNIGDVIGVAHKEYVCTEVNGAKTWVEFGDEANHITKDFAESTYLKNTASAVGTANLSDNAVTSAKLAVGTRNPIILTESTTEVDEETYQKLLRDDVDVVFKMNNADFLYRFTSESVGSGLMLNFSSLVAFPKKSIENVRVQGVQVTIKHTTPHTCKVFGIDSEPSLKNLIDDAKYLNKSTLTPILKEIDLTGTDAERKAKLDQFEKDWTALTGASDLSGARFVGNDADENHIVFVYDRENGCYTGYGSSDGTYPVGTKLGLDGSLTITPLFQHLEAVTIQIGLTDAIKLANKTAIEGYVNNLKSLGVDTTKGYNIPLKTNAGSGFLSANITTPRSWYGFLRESYTFVIWISEEYAAYRTLIFDIDNKYPALTTTSKQIVGAINEVNAAVKTKANSSDVSSKQDKLVSGTNIKTVNGTSLLGSGDITISGGSGDVTSAGNNTFTGNNTFKNRTYLGETLAEHLYFPGGEGYDATTIPSSYVSVFYNGPSNVLMVANKNSKAVPLSGIATPTGDEYAANKKYVDDQITAKLGTVLTQLQNI